MPTRLSASARFSSSASLPGSGDLIEPWFSDASRAAVSWAVVSRAVVSWAVVSRAAVSRAAPVSGPWSPG